MTFVFNDRESCSACPIRHRAICARCDDDELNVLEKIKTYRTYDAGQPIMWRGDELVHFSSVVIGIASLSRTMEDGRTQMVGLLQPSDFIGRPGRTHVEFDVTAITPVTLCSFERRPFEKLVEKTPHIAQRMLEMALDELDAARDWMLLLGRKTAQEKIATFLEMLSRRTENPQASPCVISLPLTREEMANFLGLTLETVSRQLSALKSKGVISIIDRKHIEINDMSVLLLASGDDSEIL